MIKINIEEAEADFYHLLDQVESKGEIVTICRNGKPVAQMTRGSGEVIIEDKSLDLKSKS